VTAAQIQWEKRPRNIEDTSPGGFGDAVNFSNTAISRGDDWHIDWLLGHETDDFLPILAIRCTGCAIVGSTIVFEKDE